MDSKLQRLNMVESQVRPSDVTDRRIIRAMLDVPRELFVPAAMAPFAYMDEGLTVSAPEAGASRGSVNGRPVERHLERYLLAPRTFAKLVQLAEISSDAVVLDVGCATGYSTAILARLAARVVAVESDKALAETARQTLQQQGVANATVLNGRLTEGAPAEGPFDAILLNGAVETIAPPLLEQLKDGGKLVGVFKEGGLSRAHVWQRVGKVVDARAVFEAGAAVLPGFERHKGFVF